MPASTPRNFSLQTALDPAVYNQTYNLLCVYVLFLDRGLGASKRPMAETQVAKAEAPEPPPLLSPRRLLLCSAGSASCGETASAIRRRNTVAALQPRRPTECAAADQTSAGNMPSATIRVNTRLVQFDVVVTDKDGRPVKDLKASDFQVQQDGKSQSIVAFETHAPRRSRSDDGGAIGRDFSSRGRRRTPLPTVPRRRRRAVGPSSCLTC